MFLCVFEVSEGGTRSDRFPKYAIAMTDLEAMKCRQRARKNFVWVCDDCSKRAINAGKGNILVSSRGEEETW